MSIAPMTGLRFVQRCSDQLKWSGADSSALSTTAFSRPTVSGKVGRDLGDITQRRRHQRELCLRQLQQRNTPCTPSPRVARSRGTRP